MVHVYPDGREVCDLKSEKGRGIYSDRTKEMWGRQGGICCLSGYIRGCPGRLNWADATFDHEVPRGQDGGNRDDRIEIEVAQPDGTVRVIWQNGAAHCLCNSLKGSRRIPYNAVHNGNAVWELIPKTTRSGKVLFRCSSCGYETPAPTKNHLCP